MSEAPSGFSPIPEGSLISVKTRARFLMVLLVFVRLPLIDHPQPVHPDEREFVDAINFPTPYPVHPPGYPLWTALGSVMSKVSRGEYQAYQILSVVGAAMASVFLYLILRRWVCADSTAWLIALALGLNPLMWFHAVTALNYCMATAVALAVVYYMARGIADNRLRDLKIGTSIFAVGLFLRLDLLLWIGPVWAVLALRHPVRTWAPAALVLVAAAIGNWQMTHYLYGQSEIGRTALAHTREVIWNTSVFEQGVGNGLLRNAVKLGANLAWDFGLLLPAIPVAFFAARRCGAGWHCQRPYVGSVAHGAGMHSPESTAEQTTFDPPRRTTLGVAPNAIQITNIALLAALPLIAFTLLIHMSEPGHIMLLLPIGYTILAAGLARLHPIAAKRWAFAIAVIGAAQFLLYPWSVNGSSMKRLVDAKVGYISASGLRQIDRRHEIHHPGDYWPTGASHANVTTLPDSPSGFGPAPRRGSKTSPLSQESQNESGD